MKYVSPTINSVGEDKCSVEQTNNVNVYSYIEFVFGGVVAVAGAAVLVIDAAFASEKSK